MLDVAETSFIAHVTKMPQESIQHLQRSRLQKISNALKQRLGYAAFKVKQGMAHLSLDAVNAAWGNPDFLAAQSIFAISNPPTQQHPKLKLIQRRAKQQDTSRLVHGVEALMAEVEVPVETIIVAEKEEEIPVVRVSKRVKAISPQESPQAKKAKIKTPEVDARAMRSALRGRPQESEEDICKEEADEKIEKTRMDKLARDAKSAEEQKDRDHELRKFEADYQKKQMEHREEQELIKRAHQLHLHRNQQMMQQRAIPKSLTQAQILQMVHQRNLQENASQTSEMQIHRIREAQLNQLQQAMPVNGQFRQKQPLVTPEMIQINHQRQLSNQVRYLPSDSLQRMAERKLLRPSPNQPQQQIRVPNQTPKGRSLSNPSSAPPSHLAHKPIYQNVSLSHHPSYSQPPPHHHYPSMNPTPTHAAQQMHSSQAALTPKQLAMSQLHNPNHPNLARL